MPITRIARTHIVYQFIILTLVFLCVGYYELLLERKFMMLLLVVPTFLYQLIILSCCLELIPIPRWMNLSEPYEVEQNTETLQLKTGDSKHNTEKPAISEEHKNLSNPKRDLKVSTRKYKLRNWKTCSSSAENSELHSSTLRGSSVTPSEKHEDEISLVCMNSNKIQSSEPITKSYFFPYRQKRLEEWIETKENSRPHKIRNWQSSIDNESRPDSLPVPNSPEVTSSKIPADASSSISDCSVIHDSELTKRYTFPFRQKRDQPWSKADDNEKDSPILPPTPYWHSVGYDVAVKQEARRRRRSVSSSLLNSRQIDARKYESERCKDFSQSVEISRVANDFIKEKATSTPNTTFGKIKLGIANCFFKIKKESNKTNTDKEGKKRTLKSIFQSRENFNMEPLENKHRSFSKPSINESACSFYPTYIPFQKERFESDVFKRMKELPKIKT